MNVVRIPVVRSSSRLTQDLKGFVTRLEASLQYMPKGFIFDFVDELVKRISGVHGRDVWN